MQRQRGAAAVAEIIPSEPDAVSTAEGIVSRLARPPLVTVYQPFNVMRRYFTVLSIAGSDCSGGAGIQADLKTISALGCYGMTAITSLTAQNTTGVRSIMPVCPDVVRDQIDMVFEDIPPMAIKTGMLCDAKVAAAVADTLRKYELPPLVVDPVMVATSGAKLLEDEAVKIVAERIFPLATIITPNVAEARALTGEDEPEKQIRRFREMGCRNILLKGGDTQAMDYKTDILALENGEILSLRADAVDTRNTHGTGCTLSAAIASYLAMGLSVEDAVSRAKLYITRALEAGAFITIGHGHGPVNHFFSPRKLKNFNPDRI